jgi:hypothetical protein
LKPNASGAAQSMRVHHTITNRQPVKRRYVLNSITNALLEQNRTRQDIKTHAHLTSTVRPSSIIDFVWYYPHHMNETLEY